MIKVQNGLYQCCNLYKTRTNVVLFRGTVTKDVDILFIGEAPGREEDLQGKPFVGRAGRLLDIWIKEAEIDNYAIVNIVKCRPPNNRAPKKIEIRACLPHLIKQIHDLNPKLIVALGRISCTVLINRKELIPNIGKLFNTQFGKVFVMPHPAYILRGVYIDVPIEKLKMINEQIKAEKLGTDDKEKLGTDDKEKLGTDDKEKLGTDDKEKLGTDDKEKLGTDDKEKLGTDDKEKLEVEGELNGHYI